MSGKPTVISTFAGCGGSSLGYKWAGFKELLAIEWDQNAVDTFKFDNISWPSEVQVLNNHGKQWQNKYYDLFLYNLKQSDIEDMTTIVHMDSIEASKTFDDNSIDFIHIDGCHAGDYVEEELRSWLPKMRDNSIIAGHDYGSIRKRVGNSIVSPVDLVFGDKVEIVDGDGDSYMVKVGKGLV